MARRPSLSEAGVTRPSLTLPAAARSEETAEAKRAPARQGKKAVSFWVDPAAATQLRVTSATLGRSVQAIMEEALDDWFVKQRLPALARKAA
jgi:mRNA-degrading endonuclease toxin of MazEF toxin-antitoxin module